MVSCMLYVYNGATRNNKRLFNIFVSTIVINSLSVYELLAFDVFFSLCITGIYSWKHNLAVRQNNY